MTGALIVSRHLTLGRAQRAMWRRRQMWNQRHQELGVPQVHVGLRRNAGHVFGRWLVVERTGV